VIAGDLGGQPLVAPRGQGTRPTSDRVKESLFGALGGDVVGASVLDGYAGSGALAIEALSRGAARAVLIDKDAGAVEAIRRNLRSTGVANRARVQRPSLGAFLRDSPPAESPFDLVLLDPPYALAARELEGVLERLAVPGWLSRGALVIVEQASGAAPLSVPEGWGARWERVYGDTLVRIVGP
jgi:16S rRNA (guanine966-N2)-methyltransferase